MRKKNTNEQLHIQPQFRLKPVYAAVLLAFTVQTVQANPIDATVVSGQASFATTGSTLTVTNTPGAIIHWQGFSIGANEITRFAQQSASSAVLNRVVSNNPSSILGTLQSNGRVFLINPNGIVFGAGSTVDVAGLVVSTLNLSNADFLAGRNRFSSPLPLAGEGSGVRVVNQGNITAQNGGQIYLIAPDVENTGVITAQNGEILLVAGHSVDLVNTNSPNLIVNITAPAGDATNVGQLIASSGSLGLFGTVVRNSGAVSADSATMQGGKIVFRSTQRTEAGGTISAQGVGGGEIKMLSDMQTGTVSVSGTLDASAPVSGDGGFIDTSAAHVQVADTVRVSTLAANGNNGMWLIDPPDYYVSATDPANGSSWMSNTTLGTNLGLGNVTIQTLATGAGNGDILVNNAVTWASANSLTLNAIRNIEVNATISNAGTGNLILRADLNGSSIGTIIFGASGSVALSGGGRADLYYNPVSYTDATTKSDALTNPYSSKITGTYTAWMLVNNVGLETGGTFGLQAMNTNRAGNYALGRNIDASGTNLWNAGAGFLPVGDFTTNFTGKFNGFGNTISNLTINSAGSDVGLFGVVGVSGIVSNVGLIGSNVVGVGAVGGLVGDNAGNIINSYVSNGSVNVTGLTGLSVGGLVGINSGTISNSYVSGGSVRGTYFRVGGLAGYNNLGVISNSYVSGVSVVNAATYGTDVGGMVGDNSGSISNSYVSGGSVSGHSKGQVGGLAGHNSGSISTSYASNGSFIGGTNVALGGVVGGVSGTNSGTVSNTFWDTATTGILVAVGGGSVVGLTNVTGLTTAQTMSTASVTAAGFNLATTWWMTDANTRPFLRSEYSTTIANAHQLQLMVMGLGAGYTLGANIDATETALGTGMWSSAGFLEVGDNPNAPTYGIPFTGKLDGKGFTINGLTINRPLKSGVGLFGWLGAGAVVSNVGLVGGSVTGSYRVGGLAGYNEGSISNTYVSGMAVSEAGWSTLGGLVGQNGFGGSISNSYVDSGTVLGSGRWVGGLAGLNFGNIDNSHVSNTTVTVVSGNSVGGLVGWNDGSIGNSYVSNGSVTGSSSVGGLVGWNTAIISNSYVSNDNVTGTWGVGGLVGYNSDTIDSSYALGGNVTGTNNVGGLAGYNGGTISNSYVSNGMVWGLNVSSINLGGLAGTNTGVLTNSHYDINNVSINDGNFVTLGGLYNAGGVGQYSDWLTNSLSLNIADYLLTLPGSGNNYTINSVQGMKDLLGFADNAAYTFSLGADIDLALDAGLFIPYLAASFNGSDGTNFYTISNLNVNQSFNDNLGLFGHIATGSTVSNVVLSNAVVTGNSNVGALAGWNQGAISNSHVSGATAAVSGLSNVGGLAGYNDFGSISNSDVNGGSVTGSSNVGGLVGYNLNSTIDGSHVSAVNVGGGTTGLYVGGLVGQDRTGVISNSSVDSGTQVTGGTRVGGLLGFDGAEGQGVLQSNTVTDTTVTGSNYVGGLVGYIETGFGATGYVDDNHVVDSFVYGRVGSTYLGGLTGWNGAPISNSSVTGTTVSGGASFVGGLVGYNTFVGSTSILGTTIFWGGRISNSYVSGGTVSGNSSVGGLAGSNAGEISNSFVSASAISGGAVSTANNVGGLVGNNNGGILNSYASGGTVTGGNSVGGLVGYNDFSGIISFGYADVGLVTGLSNVGGVVGYKYQGTVGDTLWNTALVGGNLANGIGFDAMLIAGSDTGAAGLTTAQLMTMSSFTGWSIANTGGSVATWRIYEGNTRPLLSSFLTPLTVTANNATKSYDGSAFSGGNGVGYSVTPTLTLLGTPAYGGTSQGAVNAGGYTIIASGLYSDQLGYDISYVDGILTINPATLTLLSLTANNASKTYGTTLAFNGTEFTPVGLQGGDTISGVTLASAGAVNTANAGTYAITPSNAVFSVGSASNYTLSYVDGQLTVTAAPLTITADALSKIYGNADPALTYVASGLLFGETLTGGLSRTAGENAGTYAINQGTLLANSNYNITYTGSNLGITARPVNVTANAISRVYGDADPALTYTVGGLGLASWDTNATAFTGALARAAGEDVAASPYDISQGTLTASNYTITFAGNIFTITSAPLSVYAFPTNKIISTPDPLLGYMVSGLKLGDTAAETLNSGSLARDAGEAVGNYQINQGSLALASSNYTMNYFPASLTILAPTVVDEIANAIMLLGTPDTGSAQSTSSSDEEERRKAEEAAAAAGTPASGDATAQTLPVCPGS